MMGTTFYNSDVLTIFRWSIAREYVLKNLKGYVNKISVFEISTTQHNINNLVVFEPYDTNKKARLPDN